MLLVAGLLSLPSDVLSNIASMMESSAWCRSGAQACKTLNNIRLSAMMLWPLRKNEDKAIKQAKVVSALTWLVKHEASAKVCHLSDLGHGSRSIFPEHQPSIEEGVHCPELITARIDFEQSLVPDLVASWLQCLLRSAAAKLECLYIGGMLRFCPCISRPLSTST